MWTRENLKNRAKANLERYYWMAFLVCLIFSVVSGIGNPGSSAARTVKDRMEIRYDSSDHDRETDGKIKIEDGSIRIQVPHMLDGTDVHLSRPSNAMSRIFFGMFASFALMFFFLAIAVSIFVGPVVEVGKNRFFMESRLLGGSAGAGKLIWGFSNHYLNVVLTSFLKNLFCGIGALFCLIPGIYLSYCFYMVPYIQSENPEMKPMDTLKLSMDMMNGHKWNTFVLELSFFGWYFLGLLLCCIGTVFVAPYMEATFAELYAELRKPFTDRLAGFGIPDVVPAGAAYGTYVNQENGGGNDPYRRQ